MKDYIGWSKAKKGLADIAVCKCNGDASLLAASSPLKHAN
jgi:hypothetical protein